MTRVKTRDVIVVAGGILVGSDSYRKLQPLHSVVPGAVLGGAMVHCRMVVSSGIRIIGSQVDLNRHENPFVIACSVGMGLGLPLYLSRSQVHRTGHRLCSVTESLQAALRRSS